MSAGNQATCHACRRSFDVLDARWCDCVGKEPTLVCPACGACFCHASVGYKQTFWRDAPQELWARKLAARRSLEVWTNPEPVAAPRPLVLIVDDEPHSRSAILAQVLAHGYGAVTAENGEEGLRLAGIYRPDLVLTDAFMPKLDGREMSRRIREELPDLDARIVLMTSLYTRAAQKQEALRSFGVNVYLEKPLALPALIDLLRRELGPAQRRTPHENPADR